MLYKNHKVVFERMVVKKVLFRSSIQALTDEFLEPFQITSGLEQAIDSNNQPFSQWVSDGNAHSFLFENK